MIKSVSIKKGLLKDLKMSSMKFTDGVNIVLGPNGCGKSVLLKTIQHHYPLTYPKPLEYKSVLGSPTWKHYLAEAICEIDIEYTGGAVYYFDYGNIQNTKGKVDAAMSGGGGLGESLLEMFNKPSSGQKTLKAINGLLNLPHNVTMPKVEGNPSWVAAQQNFIDLYTKFPDGGKPTLLLDEIETSLSPDLQLKFLDSVLRTLAQTFQVICVTHNPLAILFKKYNIINLYPDKLETYKIHLQGLVDGKYDV